LGNGGKVLAGSCVAGSVLAQEPPLPNYLPDIYAKLEGKDTKLYVTDSCNFVAKPEDKPETAKPHHVLYLERGKGRNFSKITARTVYMNDEEFGKLKFSESEIKKLISRPKLEPQDQQALTVAGQPLQSAFEKGRKYKEFRNFGTGPWGDGTDGDNFEDEDSKLHGMNSEIDMVIRQQLVNFTKCVYELLK
jgi:hypothetical protein